jgi:6-phosphogluconolactonase/glucosamine-6-phosphate isomerase/deaminase
MDRQALLGLNKYKNKDNIFVLETQSVQKANETVEEILEKYSDFKTALFLSGGSTPRKLYELMAENKKIKAGAVAQVDERFGKRGHKHSNELMIEETGLTKYFEDMNIRFYPMLEAENELDETAKDYDEALRFLLKYMPKSVGVLGVGVDGHTAGIPAISEISKKMLEDQSGLVDFYNAEKYGARITLNYHGLSMMDIIIVLALGAEKRKALSNMFKEGSIDECPARFYLKPEIAEKTILITDQVV